MKIKRKIKKEQGTVAHKKPSLSKKWLSHEKAKHAEPPFYSLLGHVDAPYLMVAHEPLPIDVEQGKVMSSAQAEILADHMQRVGLSMSDDFLVVPPLLYGPKMLKAPTQPILSFVQIALKTKGYKAVFVVGTEAYRWLLHGGMKTSIKHLCKNAVFLPDTLGQVPLIVLPDLKPLSFVPTGVRREDQWLAKRVSDAKKDLDFCLNSAVNTLKTLPS